MIDKNSFIEYLKECTKSKGMSKKCKKMITSLIRKMKYADDLSVSQFIEFIGFYFEDSISNINESENNYEMSELEEFFDSFLKATNSSPSASGTKISYVSAGKPQKYSQQPEWLKRDTFTMIISDTCVYMNESLTNYLFDIQDSMGPQIFSQTKMVPVTHIYSIGAWDDDPDDEEDNYVVECVLGKLKENIAITMIAGVTNFHKFKFERDNEDTGSSYMNKNDFYLFKKQTKGKWNGIYEFDLEPELNSLIGKKVRELSDFSLNTDN